MNNNDNQFSEEAQDTKIPVWEIFIWLFGIVGSIIVIGGLAFTWYYYSNTTRGSGYYRKNDLKKELKMKISNGADLEVLEDVFADRHKHSTDAREWDYRLEEYYYDNNATLLKVLGDLRSDYFDDLVPLATRDTAYYSRLSKIIDKYSKKTPFDGLEEGQQALFINLQKVLGDDYNIVEDKITRIVDELRSKNTLVYKYLNNSNDSYSLSRNSFTATFVFGIITIIFGIFGLNENIRSRKKRRDSKK